MAEPTGKEIREKLIEAGTPYPEVEKFVAERRNKMLLAGAPAKEVDAFWGIPEPKDIPFIPNVTAHVEASFDMLKPENRIRVAENYTDSVTAAWQSSALGLWVRGKTPNVVEDPNAPIGRLAAGGFTQLGAELPITAPASIAGGLVGSPGGFIGTMIGAGVAGGAIPAAIREILTDQYEHPGGARNAEEVLNRIGKIAWGTGKEGISSGVSSLVGGQVTKRAIEKGGGQVIAAVGGILTGGATEVSVAAGLNGQVPSANDFVLATILGLGPYAVGRGVAAARGQSPTRQLTPQGELFAANLRLAYRQTGIHPAELVRMSETDSSLRSELMAPQRADGTAVFPSLKDRALPEPLPENPYEPEITVRSTPQVNADIALDRVVDLVSHLETGHLAHDPVKRASVLSRNARGELVGAIGWNQIMPNTAIQYGFDPARLTDKDYNLQASRVILADLSKRFDGDLEAILIGYNAGPGRAATFLRSGRDYASLPAETRGYLAKAERAGVLDKGPNQQAIEQQLRGLRGDYEPPVNAPYAAGPIKAPPGVVQGASTSWMANPAYDGVLVTRRVRNPETGRYTTIPDEHAVATYLQEFARLAGFRIQIGDSPKATAAQNIPIQDVATGRLDIHDTMVYIPTNNAARMQRWFSMSSTEVLLHEAGHAIDWQLNGRKQHTRYLAEGSPLHLELLQASKDFKPKHWQQHPKYNATHVELMADAFAVYLSNPEIRSRMPEFTKAYGDRLKPYMDAANNALPMRKTKKTVAEDGTEKITVEEGYTQPKWVIERQERAKAQEDAYRKAQAGWGGNGGKPPPPPTRRDGTPDFGKMPRLDIDPTMRLTEDELIDKAMERLGDPGVRVGQRIAEPIGWFAKLRATMEDQFGGMISGPGRRLDKKLGHDPKNVTIEDMRRMMFASQEFADYFMNVGVIEPVTRNKVSNASWKRALTEVGEDGGSSEGFVSYMMYARSIELATRGINVGMDLGHAVEYLTTPGVGKKYDRAMKTLKESKDGQIDYGRKSHLFTQAQADAMKAMGQFHISLRRIMDPTYSPPKPDAMFSARQKPNKIKGDSDRDMMDVMTAEWDNTSTIIQMADRNLMLNNIANAVEQWKAKQPKQIQDNSDDAFVIETLDPGVFKLKKGVLQDEFGNDIPENVREAWAPFIALRNWKPTHPDDVLFFQDGKAKVMRVKDPDLAKLLRTAHPASDHWMPKLLETMAGIERSGITSDPTFAFRSWTVGQLSVIMSADGNQRYPFQNMIRGMLDTYGHGEYWDEYVRNGGMGSSLQDVDKVYGQVARIPDGDRGGVWNVFTDINAARQAAKNLAHAVNPVDKMRKLSNFLDTSARLSFFITERKAGVDPFKAAMNSRKAHFDYAEPMSQALLQHYARYVPFAPTMLKEAGQVGGALIDRPAKYLAMGVAVYTVPTLLNYAANYVADLGKDDEDQTRYNKQEQWLRDNYWLLPAINGKRIKLPRGIGPGQSFFSTTMERFLDHLAYANPKAFDGLMMSVIEKSLHPGLPTLLQPFVDHARNKTELGQPLISQALEGASGHMQYKPNTTETAKWLSRTLGEPVMGEYGVDFSPIVLENYIRQWTGGMPMKVLQYLEKQFSDRGAPWEPADNPFFGWFVARNPKGGQDIKDFYETHKDFERARKDLSLAKKRMNTDEMELVDLEDTAINLTGLKQAIASQRAIIDAIAATKTISEDEAANGETGPGIAMTEAEKIRWIDSSAQQMASIAYNGLKLMRQFKFDKSAATK